MSDTNLTFTAPALTSDWMNSITFYSFLSKKCYFSIFQYNFNIYFLQGDKGDRGEKVE